MIVMPPLLSSPNLPCFRLLYARSRMCLSSFLRITESTIAANIGDSGHPWEKPSVTGMSCHVPSSSFTRAIPSFSYRLSTKASKWGNSCLTMSRSSCLDMALNMFLMSSDKRALEGNKPTYSCDVMNFSTARRIVDVMKSITPCMPMA